QTPVASPVFIPERPPTLPEHRPTTATPDAAERQADRVGAGIGGFLGGVPAHGGPLPRAARDRVEPLPGVSPADVHLDTGPQAHDGADRERALAVTRGSRVAFAIGALSPGTGAGRHLIGHELAHVAQQRAHGLLTTQRFAAVLDYEQLARDIRAAVEGLGTDKEAIYRALTRLRREADAVKELEDTY